MGLYPPCSVTTTLASLDAAGIAIVQEGEAWFIKFYHYTAGPYDTAEAALETSMGWISPGDTKQVGGNAAKYSNQP
jgi:hypothetical protein